MKKENFTILNINFQNFLPFVFTVYIRNMKFRYLLRRNGFPLGTSLLTGKTCFTKPLLVFVYQFLVNRIFRLVFWLF